MYVTLQFILHHICATAYFSVYSSSILSVGNSRKSARVFLQTKHVSRRLTLFKTHLVLYEAPKRATTYVFIYDNIRLCFCDSMQIPPTTFSPLRFEYFHRTLNKSAYFHMRLRIIFSTINRMNLFQSSQNSFENVL